MAERENLQKPDPTAVLEENNIFFEGSVPARYWPPEHRGLFQLVEKIASSRYDEYIASDTGDGRVRAVQKEIRNLRTETRKLRRELNANESEFRLAIEGLVLRRFTETITCLSCGSEIRCPDFEAVSFHEDENVALQARRALRGRRLGCICRAAVESGESDINTSRGCEFHTLTADSPLRHIPDTVSNSSGTHISMKPDRVIGLNMTDGYRRAIRAFNPPLSYCAGRSRNSIFPFLVIEAKREKDAPGFRYLEVQTAFPIRSLLHLQEGLRNASNCRLEPLVWFFGYQGDIWRLYGATLQEDAVRVYDLWLGTIDSQNGALQLLQVVDLIWSWARDIYRPQIRRCLERRAMNPRGISPSSTMVPSRAASVLSDLTVRTTHTTGNSMTRGHGAVGSNVNASRQKEAEDIGRLTNHEDEFSSFVTNGQACVRRANAVAFTCRFIRDQDKDGLHSIAHAGMLIRMSAEQLQAIQSCWTGTYSDELLRLDQPDVPVLVGFIFNTFCDPSNWNLIRALHCVLWPNSSEVRLTTEIFDATLYRDEQITAIFDPLRRLVGASSVAAALQDIKLILAREVSRGDSLERPLWQHVPGLSSLENHVNRYAKTKDVLWVETGDLELLFDSSVAGTSARGSREQSVEALLPLPTHLGSSSAIVAMKPSDETWPRSCPQFCMFLLSPADFDDKARHRKLLKKELKEQRLYCPSKPVSTDDDKPVLTDDDKQVLTAWAEALRLPRGD